MPWKPEFWSNLPQNLMQPFPHPNDASYKIWPTLANWPQRYSSFIWKMTKWQNSGRTRPIQYSPTFSKRGYNYRRPAIKLVTKQVHSKYLYKQAPFKYLYNSNIIFQCRFNSRGFCYFNFFVCLFWVFYGPVNIILVNSSQSFSGQLVNLLNCSWAGLHLLSSSPVLSAHTFASTWELPFLNQLKGGQIIAVEIILRSISAIIMWPGWDSKRMIPGPAVRRAADHGSEHSTILTDIFKDI